MRIEFKSPALARPAGRSLKTVCTVPVSVEIAEVDEAAAPLVCKSGWTHEYRVFGGRFYGGAVFMRDGAAPDADSLVTATGLDRKMHAMMSEELFDWSARKWTDAAADITPELRRKMLTSRVEEVAGGPGMKPAMVGGMLFGQKLLPTVDRSLRLIESDLGEWEDAARSEAQDWIVCERQVWVPVEEPLIRYFDLGGADAKHRSLAITSGGFGGHRLPARPYGNFRRLEVEALNDYWAHQVEFHPMTALDEARELMAGISKPGIPGLTFDPDHVEISDPDAFGHGFADALVNRQARVVVAHMFDCAAGKGQSILSSKLPPHVVAAVESIFEMTRGSDPADGMPEGLPDALETFALAVDDASRNLDRLDIHWLDHGRLAAQARKAVDVWKDGPISVADGPLRQPLM